MGSTAKGEELGLLIYFMFYFPQFTSFYFNCLIQGHCKNRKKYLVHVAVISHPYIEIKRIVPFTFYCMSIVEYLVEFTFNRLEDCCQHILTH